MSYVSLPASAGAPSGSVQFNNNGQFGGSPNLTWDNTNLILQVANTTTPAASHQPTNSPIVMIGSRIWNGSASVPDDWTFQSIPDPTVDNGTVALKILHTGSAGMPLFSIGDVNSLSAEAQSFFSQGSLNALGPFEATMAGLQVFSHAQGPDVSGAFIVNDYAAFNDTTFGLSVWNFVVNNSGSDLLQSASYGCQIQAEHQGTHTVGTLIALDLITESDGTQATPITQQICLDLEGNLSPVGGPRTTTCYGIVMEDQNSSGEAGVTNYGIYFKHQSIIGGTTTWALFQTDLTSLNQLASSNYLGVVGFTATSGTVSPDVGLTRLGAGVLALGNGGLSDFSGTLKLTILNAVTGIQINGGAASGNVLRGNGTNFISAQLAYSDLSGTPSLATIATTGKWSDLVSATASLTLNNAGNATTFNQTSAVNWTWANTTAATNVASQSSPILNISGSYWNGSASGIDNWTIQNVVANGTNGTSRLTFSHTGTTGSAQCVFPNGATIQTPGVAVGGGSSGMSFSGSTLTIYSNGGILQLHDGNSPVNLASGQVDFSNKALARWSTTGARITVGASSFTFGADSAGSSAATLVATTYQQGTNGTGGFLSAGGNAAISWTTNSVLDFTPAASFSLRFTGGGQFNFSNAITLAWSAGSPGTAGDTGISRIGSASLAFGNGTNGDFTGSLKLKSMLITDTGANTDLTVQNTTAAISATSQSSPLVAIAGQYWTGTVSATDQWTIQNVLANGTNASSSLSFQHTGTTGAAAFTTNATEFDLTAASSMNLPSANGSGFTINIGGYTPINFNGNSSLIISSSTRVNTSTMTLQANNGSGVGGTQIFLQGTSSALTTGSNTIASISSTGGGFKPTSGSCNFVCLNIGTVINQTGGANGTITDLLLSCTETALVGTHNGLDIGTGGAGGNFTVNATSGDITKYNKEATTGLGLSYLRGSTSQKAETGADASVLSVTPASVIGTYKITLVMDVSAANTATLGWTATWTDSNGTSQAPTNLALFTSGTAAPALTVTASAGGVYYATAIVNVNNAGTAIVVKTTFSGTSIAYKVSAFIERVA